MTVARMLVLAAVTVVAIGVGVLAAMWWTHDPGPQMVETLESFPVPDGWHVVDGPSSRGDRPAICDLIFSCWNQHAKMGLEPVEADADPCATLEGALSRWAGFDDKAHEGEYMTDSDCIYDGSVNGHYVQVNVGQDDVGDEAGDPYISFYLG